MNAFYLNMVGSEMFLDTAQLRESAISHAKELNYIPRSKTSAVAYVNIDINTGLSLPEDFVARFCKELGIAQKYIDNAVEIAKTALTVFGASTSHTILSELAILTLP